MLALFNALDKFASLVNSINKNADIYSFLAEKYQNYSAAPSNSKNVNLNNIPNHNNNFNSDNNINIDIDDDIDNDIDDNDIDDVVVSDNNDNLINNHSHNHFIQYDDDTSSVYADPSSNSNFLDSIADSPDPNPSDSYRIREFLKHR